VTYEKMQRVRDSLQHRIGSSGKPSHGWLDREGRLYCCEYFGHHSLAEEACDAAGLDTTDAEVELERHGWIKVSHDSVYFFDTVALPEFKKPSKEQFDFVIEYLSPMQTPTGRENLEYWLEIWGNRI
jgi:hypothetical protein